MAPSSTRDEQEVRMQVYESYKESFANAPIRLMSRTASRMQALGYADMASAIGDVDWRTVSMRTRGGRVQWNTIAGCLLALEVVPAHDLE